VDQLNQGISHIEGVKSEDLKSAISAGNYRATANGADFAEADIVVIAVPTPLDKDRKPDLTFIEAACKTIAENVKHSVLVINESTSIQGLFVGL
jgi:UDP-N-acetyl-D-glucosamine dehydrogenase